MAPELVRQIREGADQLPSVDPQPSSALEQRMQHRLVQWEQIVGEARQLFEERNRTYADAVAVNGLLGVMFESSAILARIRGLRPLLLREMYDHTRVGLPEEVLQKKIRNVYQDLLVYSFLALAMMDDENWVGE
jgi:hypothetical protein